MIRGRLVTSDARNLVMEGSLLNQKKPAGLRCKRGYLRIKGLSYFAALEDEFKKIVITRQ